MCSHCACRDFGFVSDNICGIVVLAGAASQTFGLQHDFSYRFHAWPTTGPEGAFVDEEGHPLFLPHVEQWLKAMRIKLTQWSTRLLAQVSMCPRSLGQTAVS